RGAPVREHAHFMPLELIEDWTAPPPRPALHPIASRARRTGSGIAPMRRTQPAPDTAPVSEVGPAPTAPTPWVRQITDVPRYRLGDRRRGLRLVGGAK